MGHSSVEHPPCSLCSAAGDLPQEEAFSPRPSAGGHSWRGRGAGTAPPSPLAAWAGRWQAEQPASLLPGPSRLHWRGYRGKTSGKQIKKNPSVFWKLPCLGSRPLALKNSSAGCQWATDCAGCAEKGSEEFTSQLEAPEH